MTKESSRSTGLSLRSGMCIFLSSTCLSSSSLRIVFLDALLVAATNSLKNGSLWNPAHWRGLGEGFPYKRQGLDLSVWTRVRPNHLSPLGLFMCKISLKTGDELAWRSRQSLSRDIYRPIYILHIWMLRVLQVTDRPTVFSLYVNIRHSWPLYLHRGGSMLAFFDE